MFQPGEVVLVPFPFADQQTTQRRPVLVLTSADRFDDLVCLAITSSQHHEDAFLLEAGHFSEGFLPKPSWVRIGKVYSVNTALIAGSFGVLRKDVFKQIRNLFCGHFG